ncbi:MAG: energy transducer TonB [Pseudomonadota bacterium]
MKLMLDEETVPQKSKTPPRVVEIAMPEQIEQPIRRDRRIKLIDPVKMPPKPPKLATHKGDIDFVPITLQAIAPTDAVFRGEVPSILTPVAVKDRTARPIRTPIVEYPIQAAKRRLEGTCDVRFSVSARGEPFEVKPDCSHQIFEAAAKRAVLRSQFAPRIEKGRAVQVRNVVYPIEFKLES